MVQQKAPELTPTQEDALLSTMTYDTREAGSPLRKFRGLCHNIKPKTVLRGEGANARNALELKYQFQDMTGPDGTGYPEAITPYPWGTGELTFYNNNASEQPSASSAYGIWSKSITDILGAGAKVPAVKGCVLDVAYTPGHPGRRINPQTKEWEDTEIEAFVVLAVNGKRIPLVAGASVPQVAAPVGDINDVLASIADGKTSEVFAVAAMQDAIVKADANAFSQIVSDNGTTVAAALVALGKLSKDEAGVLHRAAPIA